MSKGPILMEEDSIESVGKAEIYELEINNMTDNGKTTFFREKFKLKKKF